MADRLAAKIRRNSTAHFIALGVFSTLSLLVAVAWLGMRVDANSFAHIVLLIGTAGCAIVGLTAWIAVRHDERIVKPATEMLANCEDLIGGGQTIGTSQSISTLKELARQRSIHDAMQHLRLEVDRSKTGGPHARIHSALNTLQDALDENSRARQTGRIA